MIVVYKAYQMIVSWFMSLLGGLPTIMREGYGGFGDGAGWAWAAHTYNFQNGN